MGRILVIVFLILAAQIVRAGDDRKIDSLKLLIRTVTLDTNRINALNALSWKYRYVNYDTCIHYASRALAISKNIEWEKGIVLSSFNMGAFNYLKGQYLEAISYYDVAVEIKLDQGDLKTAAPILGNIGLVYKQQGNYPKALEYYMRALRIGETLNDSLRIAVQFANIGIIYKHLNEYSTALDYYFKSLKIYNALGRRKGVASNYGNIGAVYEIQGDYPKAIEYLLEALDLAREFGDKKGEAVRLSNIGTVYQQLTSYALSLEYFFEALELYEKLGDKEGIGLEYANIGSVLALQKNYTEGEKYLKLGIEISKETGYLVGTKDRHETLSQIYEESGQYVKSLEHFKKYTAAKDSLYNEEKSKDLGKLEAKYEFEKAESEKKLRIEQEITEGLEREERRNNLQYSGILIFLVLVFTAVFMLGKFTLPARLAEGLIFFAFLLFFEFTLQQYQNSA
ncbi:MAG: tetratricopeptide repeat protein [Flavobacteriales bacterium]|nr:tetratricopeptide repeat protein [Flavobacteriales bacterium]